ncbi:glycosyltransferase family 2 protein [Coprobacter tertius]|uniref:Glycosyltransferase n=1 Tax=Coprobacter tertius TaxID=2944915 RepID=A0ABT1MJR6_9BACT|nr:glycosyltransferase family 2 protein [Coprobacter tertius]MCP9612862.1 glycosyltransferase [Coprobacter tertius]
MNRNNPLVTIVTPSYNQGQFIEETIKSVLNQTYSPIQYILVDGGSTDNTMEIVEKYRDKINIIIHEKDEGQSDAINKGFKLAEGELVGWVNSDDILYPDCVENIVSLYSKKSDGSIYYGSLIDFIDNNSKKYKSVQLLVKDKNTLLKKDYSIIQQGSFYKKDYLKACGYIDKNIHYCMDLDLWLRLLQYGPIYHYNTKPIAAFRIWENTKTTKEWKPFIKEIRHTLYKYGANTWNYTILKTYKLNMILSLKSLLIK